jgi:Fur family transcriptional regulator, ferric uptake regulator
MASEEQRRFAEFLRNEGLRFTQDRRLILAEVFAVHGHFEAEGIVAGLKRKSLHVSRASVYRTLPLLVESGMLRQVYSSEKHSHYEHIFGHEHHDHLVCTKCGRTMDFLEPKIEELQEFICRTHDFHPTSHKLEITGVCSSCASK